MTTIERQAQDEAEHVARIKKQQDPGVSRAEGWRRRGPLLPALIFMIIVTQIPFLFTLYYSTLSWNLVRPGSSQFVGLQNYVDVVKDGVFWQVAMNTVVIIVATVLISVVLGLLLALLLDRVVPRSRCRANAADHPVPGDTRCGSADVEDRDARPGIRHRELVAVPDRG